MLVALLDVNVLIALAWPNHVHHRVAQRWFNRHHAAGWATCPTTQSSFVRVSSNRSVIREAPSPQEALLLLQQIIAQPHHVFWADDITLADTRFVAIERLTGYRQITDAHLLALALRHDGRLATLDGGIRGLVPPAFSASKSVCVLTE